MLRTPAQEKLLSGAFELYTAFGAIYHLVGTGKMPVSEGLTRLNNLSKRVNALLVEVQAEVN